MQHSNNIESDQAPRRSRGGFVLPLWPNASYIGMIVGAYALVALVFMVLAALVMAALAVPGIAPGMVAGFVSAVAFMKGYFGRARAWLAQSMPVFGGRLKSSH